MSVQLRVEKKWKYWTSAITAVHSEDIKWWHVHVKRCEQKPRFDNVGQRQ